jgi:hypothetical protein
MKQWRLRAKEILVTSRGMFIMTLLLMTELVLLCLHRLIKEFNLSCHYFC